MSEVKSSLVFSLCSEERDDVSTTTPTTAAATTTTTTKAASNREIPEELSCQSFIENYVSIEFQSENFSDERMKSDGRILNGSRFIRVALELSSHGVDATVTSDVVDDVVAKCRTLLIDCVEKMLEVTQKLHEMSLVSGAGCHELLSDWNPILDGCKYWLEGISLVAIGLFGLCGNTLTLVVLGSTKDSNR